jgi:hypothetical protein
MKKSNYTIWYLLLILTIVIIIIRFHEFLKQSSDNSYSTCLNHISTFNKSYLLLKGYHQQAIQRLKQYYDQLLPDFLYSDASFDSNDQLVAALKKSLNSVIVSGTYDKIFPYWLRAHEAEDKLLLAQQRAVAVLSFDALEIPKPFHAPQDAAIKCIQDLNNRKSTFDKLKCISETSNLILQAVNKYQESIKQTNQQVLTSDELVPLLTYVLSRAKLLNLSSNITFMQELLIDEMLSSEYGYSFTTLEAAVAFLKEQASNLGVSELSQQQLQEIAEKDEQPSDTIKSARTRTSAVKPQVRKEKGMSLSALTVRDYLKNRDDGTSIGNSSSSKTPPPKTSSRPSPQQEELDRRKSYSFQIFSQFEKKLPDYRPPVVSQSKAPSKSPPPIPQQYEQQIPPSSITPRRTDEKKSNLGILDSLLDDE